MWKSNTNLRFPIPQLSNSRYRNKIECVYWASESLIKYLKLSNENHHLFIFLTLQCSWLPVLLFQTFLMIPKKESQGNIICHLHKDHVFLLSTTFKTPESRGPSWQRSQIQICLSGLKGRQLLLVVRWENLGFYRCSILPLVHFRRTASSRSKRHNEDEVTVNDLMHIFF